MASSLPTPTNRLSGVRVFWVWAWVVRRLQSSCLRSAWCGSGYRCRPWTSRPSSPETATPWEPMDGP